MERAWRTVHRVWTGFAAFTVAAWVLLPVVARRPAAADAFGWLITAIFLIAGAAQAATAAYLKRRALDPEVSVRTHREALGRVTGQSLAAAAMPQSAAVYGVLAYLLTGSAPALSLLCVVSLGGLLAVRPRLEEWREMLRTVRVDDDHRPRG